MTKLNQLSFALLSSVLWLSPCPAQSNCYSINDTVTVYGSAQYQDNSYLGIPIWVFNLTSPLCIQEAPSEELSVTKLQIVGSPPPTTIPLVLTGRLTDTQPNGSIELSLVVTSGHRLANVKQTP